MLVSIVSSPFLLGGRGVTIWLEGEKEGGGNFQGPKIGERIATNKKQLQLLDPTITFVCLYVYLFPNFMTKRYEEANFICPGA